MAEKEVTTQIKLQIEAGKANPAPPIGPALGQHGINIAEFCKQYNDATKERMGEVVPVIISVYKDRSFSFELKTPPVSYLLLKALKAKKGSGEPNKNKIGEVSQAQVEEIAKIKMVDLNATDIEAAKKIIMGSAQSMGIKVAVK